jgi:hypothetical protein
MDMKLGLSYEEKNTDRESKNRMLKRTFELTRYEIIRGWRKLHNEELHNLYPSANIIKMIKLKRMRLSRLVACMGEKCIQGFGKET